MGALGTFSRRCLGDSSAPRADMAFPNHTSLFRYSQNHGMGVVGRDHGGHPVHPPCSGMEFGVSGVQSSYPGLVFTGSIWAFGHGLNMEALLLCPHWYWLKGKASISVLKIRPQVTQLTKALWFTGKIRKRIQKLPESPHKDWDLLLRPCKVFFPLTLWIQQVFLEDFHLCLETRQLLSVLLWRQSTFGWSLPPATGAAWRARAVCRKKVQLTKSPLQEFTVFRALLHLPSCAHVSSAWWEEL